MASVIRLPRVGYCAILIFPYSRYVYLHSRYVYLHSRYVYLRFGLTQFIIDVLSQLKSLLITLQCFGLFADLL